MTEASGPQGGWAREPREPLSTVVDAALAEQLARQAARVGQRRPALIRAGLGLLVGLIVAWSSGPVAGLALGAITGLLLVGLPLALVAARARRQVSVGDVRRTGYDHDGRFVWEGATRRTHPRGWARTVERRGDLSVVRPRAPRVVPLLVPSGLLTDDDIAFLTSDAGEHVPFTRVVEVSPRLRRDLALAMAANLRTPSALVLAALLFAAEVAISRSLPWPEPLLFAAVAVLAVVVLLVVFLVLLVRARLRDHGELRSAVVGETLRLDGSGLLPGEVLLRALRSGVAVGSVVRVRQGVRWVGVPLDLVPEDARPSARP